MWRSFLSSALVACLSVSVGAQSLERTVRWDLDPTHDDDAESRLAWELEADGVAVPCANVVHGTERRCSATVPQEASAFRLRGIRTYLDDERAPEIGDWSPAIGLPRPPGSASILASFDQGASPQPSGTRIPPQTAVQDAAGAIWTLGAAAPNRPGEFIIERNGQPAANGIGSAITIVGGAVYALGGDRVWWRWDERGWWVRVGPVEPQ